MSADWTAAFDMALRQALDTCSLCGRRIAHATARLEFHEVGRCSVTTLLCGQCEQRDPERWALTAMLARRYRDRGGPA
jgi:hypothetical protein